MHLYRLSALFEQVMNFTRVILAQPFLKQSFGALTQVFCGLQEGLIIYWADTRLLFAGLVFALVALLGLLTMRGEISRPAVE